MTITNPSIELTFGTDLPSGHSTSQTISSAYIIERSITFSKQMLNGLEPSSNRVSLKVHKDCPSISDILVTEQNIRAVLKNGSTTLFTGYLSTSFSWSVDKTGTSQAQLTLEDVGTRLLTENFISSGYHTFNTTLANAVATICDKAGVEVSSSATFPSANIVHAVEGATTCKTLLTELLSEANCVYYFDNLGELMCKEISCTSVTSLPTFDSSNLYAVGTSGIKVSKSLRQYKNARVSYTDLGSADNYCIFQASKVSMGSGQHYDGLEVYTPTSGETRSPAYIEAVNALSEESLVGSGEILFVSNVRQKTMGTIGSTSCTVASAGGRYITIDAVNNANITQTPTFSVYGSIMYEKSTNIVTTANSSNNDEVLEAEMDWLHDKTSATKRANLLAQYHRYAKTSYTFYSTTSVALGTVCRLHDDLISGLDVNVLLYASKETDESDVIEYSAVGIGVMSLSDSVTETKQNYSTKSEPIISTPSTIYADESTHLEATGSFSDSATYAWTINGTSVGTGQNLDVTPDKLLYGDNQVKCVVTDGTETTTITTHVTRSEVAVESEIDMDSSNYSWNTLYSILSAQCQGYDLDHKKIRYYSGSVCFDGVVTTASTSLPIEVDSDLSSGEYGYIYFSQNSTGVGVLSDEPIALQSGEYIRLSNVDPPSFAENLYGRGDIGRATNNYYNSMASYKGHFGDIICDVEDVDEGGSSRKGGTIGNSGDGHYDNAYIENVYIKKNNDWHKITDDGGSGGTTDYDELDNRPQINGRTLTGNKTLANLNIAPADEAVYFTGDSEADIEAGEIPTFTENSNRGLQTSGIKLSALQSQIASKGTYSKPSGGIPSTDMTSAVQTSLSKADNSLQNGDDIDCATVKDMYVGNEGFAYFDSNGSLTNCEYTPSSFATSAQGTASTNHIANSTIHVTAEQKTAWTNKQDAISDLATIRAGASAGATALQSVPSTYRTSADQDTIDNGKVDKVTGKGLSTNDYTTAEKQTVADADTHMDNSTIHVTSEEKATWNGKSVVSASGTGTSITEIGYLTINGTQYKLPSGSSGGGVFFATYGTTTWSDMHNATASDGKAVFCWTVGDDNRARLYVGSSSNAGYYLTSFGNLDRKLHWLYCDHSNTWSMGSTNELWQDGSASATIGGVTYDSNSFNLSTSNVIRLANGVKIQKIIGKSTSSSGSQTISFPEAFTDASTVVVMATPSSTSTSASYGRFYSVSNITTTGFTYFQKDSTVYNISFLAIGK